MKISSHSLTALLLISATLILTACNSNRGPVVITDADIDHKVNVLTSVSDSEPLSVAVRRALRNNGQTAVAAIQVSQDSEDTVKLSGNVSNDAVRHEAERVAYQVDGVRFVVNNLVPQP